MRSRRRFLSTSVTGGGRTIGVTAHGSNRCRRRFARSRTTCRSACKPLTADAGPTRGSRVDVVVYCNPVGAYSTGGRVTISGADFGNGMPQALELIFHEASHVESLEAPLTTLVEEAFHAAGGEAPERSWHDMIFFTTGTIMRIVLDELGQHDYRHYGEFGVYQRGERWAAQLPLLEQYWQPFLESGSADADERNAALEAVAERLLTKAD